MDIDDNITHTSNPWSDYTQINAEHAGHSSANTTSLELQLSDDELPSRAGLSTPVRSLPAARQQQVRINLLTPVQSPTPTRPHHSSVISNISMHAENSPNHASLHVYPPTYSNSTQDQVTDTKSLPTNIESSASSVSISTSELLNLCHRMSSYTTTRSLLFRKMNL